jgi:hypothetical protein
MHVRKRIMILWALVLLAVLSFGCVGVTQEGKNNCPDCGTLFKVQTSAPTSNPVRY